MKISEQWLRSLVNIDRPLAEIAATLTLRGLEVEAITPAAAPLPHVVVAEIRAIAPHPQAERLRVCSVYDGQETLQIVCGALNAHCGLKVACAKIGAVLPDLNIKKSKIRGVESYGMLCSAQELGLSHAADGILELPQDAPLGVAVTDYFMLEDSILEIAIPPNRGDCASVLGIAREVAAMEGGQLLPLSATLSTPALWSPHHLPSACTLYLTAMVTALDPTSETPVWLKERLRRSGLRSLHVAVDVTNYVMLECGQPLHAFDAQKISGDIQVRFAKADETLTLLNDRQITLDTESLIIADAIGPIALAGIMGGKRAAVSSTTTAIILESAHFLPKNIARTARFFTLSSDAAYRFERGVDPELPTYALQRSIELINSMAGGVSLMHIGDNNIQQPVVAARPLLLRFSKLERVLGIEIKAEQVKQYFSALGFEFETTAMGIVVTPPSYRFDIHLEEDLIEEVLRMYGCDAVAASAPQPCLSLQPALLSTSHHNDVERLILKSRGYHEIISYSFVDEKLQTQLCPHITALKLKNPMSSEMAVMRTTLWTGLLSTLLYNLNRQQTRARLFEVGVCFIGAQQSKKIAGMSYGPIYPESWKKRSETSDFYSIKDDIGALLAENHLDRACRFVPGTHPALHPTQSACIVNALGEILGEIGVLHPQWVQALQLSSAPVMFELDYHLLKQRGIFTAFSPLSKFPEVRRDLAFLISTTISATELTDYVLSLGQSRIQAVTIFDVYHGKGIPPGMKSIAISLILQDFSKTLTDAELATLVKKVIDLIEKRFGATLRD